MGLSCLSFLVSSAQDSTRYRYFLGTNFDFIDGLETKKLYHHINITIPDAFSSGSGFIGGVYQTRQVSKIDTISYLSRGNNQREPIAFPTNDPASLRIVLVDSAFLQMTTTTKALGAYFQPTFRIVDADSTSIHLIGHLEYAHRNIEQKYIVSSKPRDTLTISKTDLGQYSALPYNRTVKKNQDEGYFGAGVLIYHKNKFVELQAKGVLGLASLDKWRAFYGVDVSLMVLKGNFELGLSYKGLLPNYPPYFLNVHLSKVFYLDEIGKLLE